ncbi:hypothetical protein ATE68_00080 [Sphingopyxis sp. H038]|nr:hypothetical protein ATE78_00080 [Sphingopyxis sp. H012]KTE06049.1 hypothetical protein ATE70_23120 [Sphingopyxis sp. H053]KTE15620.1 hypothetical protein ATE76_02260 [Sphingopyxis sp. H093]KTE21719.1 hypothetical protein ATE67_03395 [Sphingopyxis sp. H050]KTE22367.1 hypothetical protein ATE75_20490 [Sphingopyxis sp. H080]KTE36595.1 hypothetical protein ATE68_00080 [Sphingopyxis sp. H038]KTE49033.1 hypothetical protein ATE73_00085 [Sphingopyxis sp. H077]KTE61731.1 hypothetical protein ATE
MVRPHHGYGKGNGRPMIEQEQASWKSRDYFAEMYVAGLMADAGWNLYFPHRDQGFDMIATYAAADGMIVRPVQVKGKYPTEGKTDKARYGYVGPITAFHDDMILAIPLFAGLEDPAPRHIAWMPRKAIRPAAQDRWRCEPARFVDGLPKPRDTFLGYFDQVGLMRWVLPTIDPILAD